MNTRPHRGEENRRSGNVAQRSFVVLSDRHMSPGVDRNTGRWSRHELFQEDLALERLLDEVDDRVASDEKDYSLVLLRDAFDFVHAAVCTTGLDDGEEAAADWLDRIAAGYEHVFSALGRLVNAGARLSVVAGNHDVELLMPGVQQHFRDALAAAGGSSDAVRSVECHAWIFFRSRLIYAAHGSQYHDFNALPNLLVYADLSLSRVPPPGSHLTRYLLGLGDSRLAYRDISDGVLHPRKTRIRSRDIRVAGVGYPATRANVSLS